MENNSKQMTLNIHLVRKQFFYAPLYLAVNQLEAENKTISVVYTEEYKSDNDLVKALLDNSEVASDENTINIFITGLKDIQDNIERSKNPEVYLWHILVNRLPVQLMAGNLDDAQNFSFRNYSEEPIKVLCPPEGTTLYKYIKEFYASGDYESQDFSGFCLEPLEFDQLYSNIKSEDTEYKYGFSIGDPKDGLLFRAKNFHPPIEPIPFSCIFSGRQEWNNKIKREFLFELTEKIQRSIVKIYDFKNFTKYIKERTYEYDNENVIALLIYDAIQKNGEDVTKDEKIKRLQTILRNLKWFAKFRIWSFDLINTLKSNSEDLPGINVFEEKDKEYLKTIHDYTLRSAIAAVMSRNLSHNLGSHVFFYTKKEVDDIIAENDTAENVEKLKGLSHFLNYIQERQDFIATLTAQDDFNFGPLNFKTHVFDELTPDAVDKRHSVNSKYTRNYILKYIAFSEGIERDNEAKEIELIIEYPDEIRNEKNEAVRFNSFGKTEDAQLFYDINFAVKGFFMSRHAFLIIIENIIRNAAKHGKAHVADKKLDITISLSKENDIYTIRIYDNCGNGESASNMLQKILDELLVVDLEGNGKGKQYLHKGLKEILTCVGWLKGIPITDIFNVKGGIHNNEILQIEDYNGNLCYSFTLPGYSRVFTITDLRKINSAMLYRSSQELYPSLKQVFPRLIADNDSQTEEQHNALITNNELNDYFNYVLRKFDLQKDNLPIICFEREGFNKDSINLFDQSVINFFQLDGELNAFLANTKNKIRIVFKNHFEKFSEYEEFYRNYHAVKEYYLPEDCIEGISGANFTFNILQKFHTSKDINELSWLYLELLESFYNKICIIDERLCSGYYDYHNYKTIIKLAEMNRCEDYFSNLRTHHENCINNLNTENEKIQYLIKNQDDIFDGMLSTDVAKYHNYFFKQRHIYLYDMNTESMKCNNLEKAEASDLTQMNFISIHVGLLDKVAKSSLQRVLQIKKNNYSNYDKLLAFKIINDIPGSTYLCVHTGRGTASSEQNGEELTLIPFTTLKWSLMNSKFMLNQLFNSLQYKPIEL